MMESINDPSEGVLTVTQILDNENATQKANDANRRLADEIRLDTEKAKLLEAQRSIKAALTGFEMYASGRAAVRLHIGGRDIYINYAYETEEVQYTLDDCRPEKVRALIVRVQFRLGVTALKTTPGQFPGSFATFLRTEGLC